MNLKKKLTSVSAQVLDNSNAISSAVSDIGKAMDVIGEDSSENNLGKHRPNVSAFERKPR